MKRKSLLSIYYLFVFCTISYAIERPERIPDKLEELEPKGWYLEKARSWQEYLSQNPEDKSGWMEYFKATQYSGADPAQVWELANQISKRFPGSFESYYVLYQATGWTSEGVEKLKQALSMAPDSKNFLTDRIMLAEFSQDGTHRSSISNTLFEGRYLYPSLLNYSYNVLMSVSENGVLIVQGEPSTIPLWILQDVMEVRRDVKVLDLDLGENKTYLRQWLGNNKIKDGDQLESRDAQDLIGMLPDINPDTDFFFGLTLPTNELNTIEERLYVVGLASLHRNESFDHYGLIKENIENKFMIDYLTVDFNGEPKNATGRVYETNYILPFLLLKEYYDNLGDAASSNKWLDIILTLADRSQIKNRISMLMEKQEAETVRSFKFVEIDVKELDDKMKKVKDNLFASSFELTNKEFWFYLDYLYTNDYKELYKESSVDLTKYNEITSTLLLNYHYSPANAEAMKSKYGKKQTEAYLNYPALDMTYDAAKTYCEWLTVEYNQQPDREFQQVRFRLPSRKEWTMAALGYKEFTSWNLKENTVKAWDTWVEGKGTIKNKKDIKEFPLSEYEILYPWWHPNIELRDHIRNQKDCYMANVKAPEEIICAGGFKGDGWTAMSAVGSYFPNGMGLYDVIGNVAEMIDEDGKAMGGSWNHLPEESTISSINLYNGSDITVGFRLFMEVIEE